LQYRTLQKIKMQNEIKLTTHEFYEPDEFLLFNLLNRHHENLYPLFILILLTFTHLVIVALFEPSPISKYYLHHFQHSLIIL